MNGLPWWVKGIATVGFPVAITAFLLAQSAGWIPSEIRTLSQAVAARRSVMDQHVKTTEDIAAAIRIAARVMCENAARDEQQRRNCETIR